MGGNPESAITSAPIINHLLIDLSGRMLSMTHRLWIRYWGDISFVTESGLVFQMRWIMFVSGFFSTIVFNHRWRYWKARFRMTSKCFPSWCGAQNFRCTSGLGDSAPWRLTFSLPEPLCLASGVRYMLAGTTIPLTRDFYSPVGFTCRIRVISIIEGSIVATHTLAAHNAINPLSSFERNTDHALWTRTNQDCDWLRSHQNVNAIARCTR